MKENLPTLRELLRQSGFRLRSGTRADCAHCQGNSRGTVSYTAEVAYCHRCGWRSNRARLMRVLHPQRANPRHRALAGATVRQLRDRARRLEANARVEALRAWADAQLDQIARRERELDGQQLAATAALHMHPDSDAAWAQLARLADEQRALDMAWDFLACARTSQWFAEPSSLLDVYRAWLRAVEAAPPLTNPCSGRLQAGAVGPLPSGAASPRQPGAVHPATKTAGLKAAATGAGR